jgi:ankyrin repeat protein
MKKYTIKKHRKKSSKVNKRSLGGGQDINSRFKSGFPYLPIYPKTAQRRPPNQDELGRQLALACRNGNLIRVVDLLNRGADVHFSGNRGIRPIVFAIMGGHLEVVKTLIEHGANKEDSSEETYDTTPIIWATLWNQVTIVDFLIEENVNINHTTKKGQTALLIACEKGYTDIVISLILAGAFVNQATSKGDTPLSQACQEGNLEIVNALLEYDANINATNDIGASPLMIAINFGHNDVAEALILSGADLTIRDKNGETALDLANKSDKIIPGIKDLLQTSSPQTLTI